MMCGECGRVNHFSTVCRTTRQGTSRKEEQNKEQIKKVKNNHFIHHYKYGKASIDTKIVTTSFYNSINIRYKLDMGEAVILYHSICTKYYSLKSLISM